MSTASLNVPHPLALTPTRIDQYRTDGFVGPFKAFEPEAMKPYQTILERSVLETPTSHCPFGLRISHLDSRAIYELCSAHLRLSVQTSGMLRPCDINKRSNDKRIGHPAHLLHSSHTLSRKESRG